MTSKRLSVRKIALYLFLGLTGAFAIWLVANLVSGSNTRIRIDESTTYITDTSQRDPSKVDYVEYVNARLSKGVSTRNNSVVLLVRYVPDLGPDATRKRFFRLLGMNANELEPSEFESPYHAMEQILKERDKKLQDSKQWTEEIQEENRNQLFAFMHSAWDANKFPLLKKWLEAQDANLDIIRDAANRSRYFAPLVCEETSGLVSALLPVCQHTREFSRGLALRAMHHLHEGNITECQADLIAIRKLARHLSNGPFIVQKLIAFSNFGIARNAEWAMAQHSNVSKEELEHYLSTIQSLTFSSDCLQETFFYERLMILDIVNKIAHYGADGLQHVRPPGRRNEGFSAGSIMTDVAISMIDWNVVLQEINLFFDQVQVELKNSDLAAQSANTAVIEKELTRRAEKSQNRYNIALAILGGRKAKGKLASHFIVASFMPAVSVICSTRNDAIIQERIIRCLMGVEIHKKKHGREPGKLSESDAISSEDFVDLYTGKEFEFNPQREPALYSYGPNQKDDQGRSRYSTPSGDDIPLNFE